MDGCSITIDSDYYDGTVAFPCDYVNYLTSDGEMTTSSSVTIWLGNNNSYPSLSFGFNRSPVYRTSYNNERSLSVEKISFNEQSLIYRLDKYKNPILFLSIFAIFMLILVKK